MCEAVCEAVGEAVGEVVGEALGEAVGEADAHARGAGRASAGGRVLRAMGWGGCGGGNGRRRGGRGLERLVGGDQIQKLFGVCSGRAHVMRLRKKACFWGWVDISTSRTYFTA